MREFARRLWGAVICLALIWLLAACGAKPSGEDLPGAAADPAPVPAPAEESGCSSAEEPASGTPEKPAAPAVPETPMSAEPADKEPPADKYPVEVPAYTFGTPLAPGEPVEDGYFDTVVFLGDSRTEGLQLYSGLKRGDYLWYRGAVTYIADDPKYAVFPVDGGKATMLGALGQKEYDAVYIMTGINELGNTAKRFRTTLERFVDRVVAEQPEAVVYLQTIPPVNDALLQSSGKRTYITNAGIDTFNAVIAQVAAEKRVVLLDVAEVYRGEDGQLPEDLTSDGCHFKAKYYARWADYLRSHVLDAEAYHALRAQSANSAESVEERGEECP